MAIMVDYDIFWLDIAIYDFFAMEISETDQYFDEAVSSLLFSHSLHFSQIVEELATRAV